jgi:phage major head subunit gpT-like protein
MPTQDIVYPLTSMLIQGHIIEGQTLDQSGHEVRVTILKGGKSINGYYYNQAALQSVAKMIEGARAYADHGRTEADRQTRSVHDMIGFYKDAQYFPPDASSPLGRVDATLHIMEAAQWLWSMIKEAVSLGKPDLIGLSIDIFGNWQHSEQLAAREVTKVVSLNSCDIVTRPSAGGSFQRILHSTKGGVDIQASNAAQSRLAFGSEGQKGRPSTMPDPITTDQNPPANPPAPPAPPVNPPAPPPTNIQEDATLVAIREQMQAALAQVNLDRSQLTLERRLMECVLPEAVKAPIRARYASRVFEAQSLESDLTAATTMMAELSRAGLVRDHGYERPTIGTQITEAEKVQAAFDRMFDMEIDTARLGNIRGFTSIREAYARVTGDPSINGLSEQSQLGSIRVSEAAPMVRITEADTTTASFSYLLGTSMNKRLLKDYQAWPAEWQKFCSIVPIKDFKQQSRVRLGHFGSLSTVAEDTAYTTISLQDSAAVYVPQKRGNLVTVSRETIINDDLMAIKQIPTKLAVSAAYTLAEFVYNFLSANPTIYDGSALFLTGSPHTNLGSAALSSAAMQTGVTSMRKQTNFASKLLGLRPKYLIVPPDLEFVAMVVTKSAGVPGSNNNDINPMLGYVQPIVSAQLTNASQWYFAADPMIIDTIEVGFVGGQVNPALFVQDQPLYGLNFTQDAISYKVRHEYGGAVVDYRGLYRGI